MNTAFSHHFSRDHRMHRCHQPCLLACLAIFLMAVGCGPSEAQMESDARTYAELNREYMTVVNRDLTEMNLSMMNKTRYKGTHKADVAALKDKLDAIDKKYSSGNAKTKFQALMKKAAADLR